MNDRCNKWKKIKGDIKLNPIEKFKVSILHLNSNRAWNHFVIKVKGFVCLSLCVLVITTKLSKINWSMSVFSLHQTSSALRKKGYRNSTPGALLLQIIPFRWKMLGHPHGFVYNKTVPLRSLGHQNSTPKGTILWTVK